jgi:signal peptidase
MVSAFGAGLVVGASARRPASPHVVPPPAVGPSKAEAARAKRQRWSAVAPIAIVAIAVLLPAATALVGVWLSGSRLQIVRTGSMEPAYPVGALLVVGPVDPADVRVGDALMYEVPGRRGHIVTHRVVEILDSSSGVMFRTQGDANGAPDVEPVPARAVRGRVRWAVPHLGRAARALHEPAGLAALVGTPAALLAVTELDAWRRRRRQPPTCHACFATTHTQPRRAT